MSNKRESARQILKRLHREVDVKVGKAGSCLLADFFHAVITAIASQAPKKGL